MGPKQSFVSTDFTFTLLGIIQQGGPRDWSGSQDYEWLNRKIFLSGIYPTIKSKAAWISTASPGIFKLIQLIC